MGTLAVETKPFTVFRKKNLNTSRPFKHFPVRGENVDDGGKRHRPIFRDKLLPPLNITCNRVCHLYAIKHTQHGASNGCLSSGVILVAASHFPIRRLTWVEKCVVQYLMNSLTMYIQSSK